MTILDAEKIRMPLGHYKDELLGEIAAKDPLYLDYMRGRDLRDTYLVEAIEVLVDKHSTVIAEKLAKGEKALLLDRLSGAGSPQGVQMKLF